jgi:hypothetical protein
VLSKKLMVKEKNKKKRKRKRRRERILITKEKLIKLVNSPAMAPKT